LPLMPIEESDWHRKVKDVVFERLFPREQVAVAQPDRGLFDERGV
jgi:hypothetical protein